MPSNKSILVDLHAKKLKPNKGYGVGKDNKLVQKYNEVQTEVEQKVVETKVEKKDLAALIIDQQVCEEETKVVEVHTDVEHEVVEEAHQEHHDEATVQHVRKGRGRRKG